MNFADYLSKYHKEGKSDFFLKAVVTSEGELTFYIYPTEGGGETLFVGCEENMLSVLYQLPANFRVIEDGNE